MLLHGVLPDRHTLHHLLAATSTSSDADRAALEDEIDCLTREKSALQSDLCRFKQHQSGARIQIDDLERRLDDMERRQLKIVAFLQQPKFLDSLIRLAGGGSEESAMQHRKRRLLGELDYAFNGDFCDKLRLELCPAVSGNGVVSQSSNEGSHQTECLTILPKTLELSDTGASRKGLPFPRAPEEEDGCFRAT